MRIGFPAKPIKALQYGDTDDFRLNLQRMEHLAAFLDSVDIDYYRFPSKMFPNILGTFNGEAIKIKSMDYIKNDLLAVSELGKYFRMLNIRTSVHASHYCNPISKNDMVVAQSVAEVEALAFFLTHFGKGWIELRIGAPGKENRKIAIDRFESFLNKLTESARSKIRIENDSRKGCLGTVEDCIYVADTFNVNLVFDIGNFSLNPLEDKSNPIQIVEAFVSRWGQSTPSINYDNYKRGTRAMEKIDEASFWTFIQCFEGKLFDVMIETKRQEFDVIAVKNYAYDNGLERYL